MVEKNTWIIGKCGTEWDGVDLERVYGTKEQIKKYLVDCVLRDKSVFEDDYDYGIESVNRVEERSNGNLYAYGVYHNTHIDYEAMIEKTPRNLDYLTWNDLYEKAIGAACGESTLKAKDEARFQVRTMVLERTGEDIETAEIPEDEVEYYCDMYNISFDENGNIVEHD